MSKTNRRNNIAGDDQESFDSRFRGNNVWTKQWSLTIILFSSFYIIAAIPMKNSLPSINNGITSMAQEHQFYPLRLVEKALPKMENDCTQSICQIWGVHLCCFQCYGIEANLVTKIIDSSFIENNCTQFGGIALILEEVEFEDGFMNKNWWDIRRYVAHLSINRCYLLDIENDAFNSKYFSATKTISFSKSQIPNYRKNMFRGMKNIANFEIYDSNLANHPNPFEDPNSDGIKFEFGVLENFNGSITILQVQRSIILPEAIKNLTGIELNRLQIIDFRFNERLTSIPAGAFKTKMLNQLFISDNDLTEINDFAFINAPNLSSIFLDNNKLKTINGTIFTSLKNHNNISIRKNDWICNCNFEFLTMYKKSDLEETTCNVSIPLKDILDKCTIDLIKSNSSENFTK